jgi:hypothetical protein
VSDESTLVRLARVPVEIRKLYNLPATYNRLHKLVLDGVIPAERIGCGIYVDQSSYHDIARELRRAPIRQR